MKGSLRPRRTLELPWLSAWHDSDGQRVSAHFFHETRVQVPPMQHHAVGFALPDGHGEETASAAASRFETPRSCGPSNKRRRATVGTSRRSSVRSFAVPSVWPDKVDVETSIAEPPRHNDRVNVCLLSNRFLSATGRTKRGTKIVWHIAASVEGQMARTECPAWRLQQRLASEVDQATRSAIIHLSFPFKWDKLSSQQTDRTE